MIKKTRLWNLPYKETNKTAIIKVNAEMSTGTRYVSKKDCFMDIVFFFLAIITPPLLSHNIITTDITNTGDNRSTDGRILFQ